MQIINAKSKTTMAITITITITTTRTLTLTTTAFRVIFSRCSFGRGKINKRQSIRGERDRQGARLSSDPGKRFRCLATVIIHYIIGRRYDLDMKSQCYFRNWTGNSLKNKSVRQQSSAPASKIPFVQFPKSLLHL